MPHRLLVAAAVAVVVVPVLGGCNRDGRSLAPASSTTTSTTTAIGGDGSLTPLGPLRVTSPAVADQGELPPEFTCDGADVSPELHFTNVPASAAELAVSVIDPDARGTVHWLLSGLAPTTARLASGEVPQGAVLATNDLGVQGWSGPCPPEGETHTYVATLYVLAEQLGLEPGAAADEGIDQIELSALDSATLTFRYGR